MKNGTQLTVAEVAERLSVSSRTITRWIRGENNPFPNAYKKNPHLRNSHYVIPVEDVEAFERERSN